MLRAVHGDDLAGRHRVVSAAARPASSPSGCAAQPRDQRDAEAGAHQREVGVELHRLVGDPGQPAGAVVHPGQPLAADRALGGGDPALVDQVARADPRPAGERVVAVHDHVGHVVGEGRGREVLGDGERRRRPSCAPRRGRSGPDATRSTVSHGSRSVRVSARSGCASRRSRIDGRDQAAHRGRERRDPQVPGDGAGLRGAGPASTCSRSVSSRAPASTRCRPCPVSITPRPTRSSSGTPVCRSRRLTCWDTALGVKPSASAAATTEPWVSTARREARAAGRS